MVDGNSACHVPYSYIVSIEQAGGVPVVLPPLSQKTDIPRQCQGVDGVLLIGGPDLDATCYGQQNIPEMNVLPPVVNNYYLALARYLIHETSLPLLGICLGHQTLNVAEGGTLWTHIPHDLPNAREHRRVNPPEETWHSVRLEPNGPLPALYGVTELTCNSSHHQAIRQVAPGWMAVAHADDSMVEAICPKDWQSSGRFLLGVQWHPERLIDRPCHLHVFSALVRAAQGN